MPPYRFKPSPTSGHSSLLRLATSIRTGTTTSSAILRKLSAYPRQNGLAKALREIGRIERTLFTLDWTYGALGATLAHTYSAGYIDQFPGADALPRRVGPTTVWDLQVRLAAPAGWRWSVTVQNLFDRDPPASNQQRTAQLGYNPQLSSPLGRSMALQAAYAFR